MKFSTCFGIAALLALPLSYLTAATSDAKMIAVGPSHSDVARAVADMISDGEAQRLVNAKGMNILNVMWEDTGRYLGSSVGPNISDVTIEVETKDGRGGKQNFLMPVIRHPNFTDKTADIKLDTFYVRVGNQRDGDALETISLKELLAHPARYMSLPRRGAIKGGTLLSKRDQHVLVSAQSAFLPIAKGGQTSFYPVIFNYQSYAENPAVLTILVTRQGTSMTIIDNSRDTVSGGASWGQRLYFNASGQRAPLTAERLADVKASGVTANGEAASSLGKDSNLLMLIQVPLKVKAQPMMIGGYDEFSGEGAPAKASMAVRSRAGGSDIDVAVLGHGASVGPFTELDNLTIERDDRFPVRVTVQFYQATSNGIIGQEDIERMADQIETVYAKGDYVGSLVVPEAGPSKRPTAWDATQAPPHLGWNEFPGLVERYHRYGQQTLGWYTRRFSW